MLPRERMHSSVNTVVEILVMPKIKNRRLTKSDRLGKHNEERKDKRTKLVIIESPISKVVKMKSAPQQRIFLSPKLSLLATTRKNGCRRMRRRNSIDVPKYERKNLQFLKLKVETSTIKKERTNGQNL